jgi:hypothetical protein
MKVLRKKVIVDIPREKVTPKEEEPKRRKSNKNNLPKDEYREEFEPLRLPIDESMDLVISVKRGGELGLPHVDIRQYLHTEVYTGFTKKGINIPVEFLLDLEEMLEKVHEECEKRDLL